MIAVQERATNARLYVFSKTYLQESSVKKFWSISIGFGTSGDNSVHVAADDFVLEQTVPQKVGVFKLYFLIRVGVFPGRQNFLLNYYG